MSILLVCDSHPVQYRVPIWRSVDSLRHLSIHVIYASDCSVRGHADKGFGREVAWDDPMLEGYRNTVINSENGNPLTGWNSLTGKSLRENFIRIAPTAILLTGLNYRYDLSALLHARSLGIPVWLRCENQDHAMHRGLLKRFVRGLIFRTLYSRIDRFFYIGNLNRQHYIAHGVSPRNLVAAYYTTLDRFFTMGNSQKTEKRLSSRRERDIGIDDFVIGFSGKFIPKKNPDLLFEMIPYLSKGLRQRTVLYFVGSGEMEAKLLLLASNALEKWNVRTCFVGFANQSEMPQHYLAMDVLALPSRKMGETWGLVANEAMQAGCCVVVSDAVGCSADFASLERFEVFVEHSAIGLATAVEKLSLFDRNFDWAEGAMSEYSIENIARTLLGALQDNRCYR